MFLSSVQFATQVLRIFNESVLPKNINRTYSFLFGDFWGDPRDADTLFDLIMDLVTRGHKVYALRNEINGTEMFQEHMASIRYNSTEWRRNKWLQEYWKKYFNCTDGVLCNVSQLNCTDKSRDASQFNCTDMPCNASQFNCSDTPCNASQFNYTDTPCNASQFNCTETACNPSQSLPPIYRPILRNYKALLVMDGVSLIRKFVVDDTEKYPNISRRQLNIEINYGLADYSKNITVQSNLTGNTFIYGIPKSSLWIQPIEWQFKIIELYSWNSTCNDLDYAIWTIGGDGHTNSSGSLNLFDHNAGNGNQSDNTNATLATDLGTNESKQRPAVFGICPTIPPPLPTSTVTDDPCDPDKLHGMVGLIVVVLILLIVVCLIYYCHETGGISGVKHLLRSIGKDILIVVTVFSIIISFWITFGDEALDCDSRADDFLVSLSNGICFSVLLIYLVCRRFENRLWKLCLKIFGFIILVVVQIVLSAVAHLDDVDEDTNNTAVKHCFDERSKSVSVGSYLFGGIILLGCIAFVFIDVCCKRDEEDQHIGFVDVIKTVIAVALGILYIVALVFVLFVDESKCIEHGQFFILLALFPAIMGLLAATISTFTEIYAQRRHRRNMAMAIQSEFLVNLQYFPP